jgi:predicted GIY-YIG superfamily endonuclease
MKEKISGIYKITNLLNGKMYIGSAVNVRKRWHQHRHGLRCNKHDNRYS